MPLKRYTVTQRGVPATLWLDDEDAARLGATPVEPSAAAEPERKARRAPNKARRAPNKA